MYDPYNAPLNPQQYNVGGENAIPIGFVKNYNVFANNIQDYTTRILPIIYEDSIPMRGGKHDLTTLSERILLYEYIKNNLVSYEEGEEGCMNANGGINLMRQLKYLSPHPVNYNILYTNPLQGLAKGLRIYRTCYPITTDRQNKTMCVKNSLGIHIRFYNNEYFNINKQHSNTNKNVIVSPENTNTKRELEWYRYIRENVLLTNSCPHFVLMYAYYTCLNCSEQFNELDKSKIVRPMAAPFTMNMKPDKYVKITSSTNNSCMVVLTEAPNMNILEWMTNERTYDFNKRQQSNHGYHHEEEWQSIYFQLIVAIYVLTKNDIYIEDFGYENIWIKQVPDIGYWIYIIEGIKYYVPNCGFIVLIDTSFRDINRLQSNSDNQKKRIKSNKLFEDDPTYELNKMFTNIFNKEPFGRGLINASVRLPHKSILDMVSECHTDIQDRTFNIPNIINKEMSYYLHTKLGDQLDENLIGEQFDDNADIREGDSVCYTDDHGNKKFGIYSGGLNILTKNNKNIDVIQRNNADLEKVISDPPQLNYFKALKTDLNSHPLAVYTI